MTGWACRISDEGIVSLTEAHRWCDIECGEGGQGGCILGELKAAGIALRAETVVKVLLACGRLSMLDVAGMGFTEAERRTVVQAARKRASGEKCSIVFDWQLEPKVWGIPVFV